MSRVKFKDFFPIPSIPYAEVLAARSTDNSFGALITASLSDMTNLFWLAKRAVLTANLHYEYSLLRFRPPYQDIGTMTGSVEIVSGTMRNLPPAQRTSFSTGSVSFVNGFETGLTCAGASGDPSAPVPYSNSTGGVLIQFPTLINVPRLSNSQNAQLAFDAALKNYYMLLFATLIWGANDVNGPHQLAISVLGFNGQTTPTGLELTLQNTGRKIITSPSDSLVFFYNHQDFDNSPIISFSGSLVLNFTDFWMP